MKENWFSILIFSIIFGILGFLLGRVTCTTCCTPDPCCASDSCGNQRVEKRIMMIEGEDIGDHENSWMMDGTDDIQVVIEDLGEDFIGDTTLTINGMKIDISKSEDGQMEVEVESSSTEGSMQKEIRKEIRVQVTDEK